MTGYGVYEAPIAEVYKKIGLNTQILNRSYHNDILTPHKHLEYILKELKN